MIKLEKDLWRELKRIKSKISWTRLENRSLLGTPDLLGYNDLGRFFLVELKLTFANKIRFSPHQISFHIRHPLNTFILVKKLAPSSSKLSDKKLDEYYLYEGKDIQELVARGLSLDACCSSLDACRLKLESLA